MRYLVQINFYKSKFIRIGTVDKTGKKDNYTSETAHAS